jgi:hypothetical protein
VPDIPLGFFGRTVAAAHHSELVVVLHLDGQRAVDAVAVPHPAHAGRNT